MLAGCTLFAFDLCARNKQYFNFIGLGIVYLQSNWLVQGFFFYTSMKFIIKNIE